MVDALAIDVGTSSVRTALVDERGAVRAVRQAPLTIRTPQGGEVELDGDEIARLVVDLSHQTLAAAPSAVAAVGVSNQRASTLIFDPTTGRPIGPVLGWQDLRTVLDCLVLQGSGLRLAPNQPATKAAWLVTASGRRAEDVRMATIETWVEYVLSGGTAHLTDHSNAAITGLVTSDARDWDPDVLDVVGLHPAMLARIVDSAGDHGEAMALPGSPSIRALIGDQPASMLGQSIVERGTKITFGTGAMINTVTGSTPPPAMTRFDSGCFPIVARSMGGEIVWGAEGIVLSAGGALDWLRDEWSIVATTPEIEGLAGSVPSSDGVWFVPALNGLGTPWWDFGARAAFFGLTRGSTTAHLARAALEGIAHRGADLVAAVVAHAPEPVTELRVDGGMSDNGLFLQMLADVTGLPIAVSPEREATTRGAGLLALVGAGEIDLGDVATLWTPRRIITPLIDDDERSRRRSTWGEMVERARRTIPELSAVSF